ncbi:putative Sec1 family protein [Blattamonas nauphoetae]|uniref:Sec1 family protein n=1 Tax=Blattamonas nauphoetae TaxID=2049346 RepID=A0ABQ9X949_9EUKA|nr:putative Sec1 family protein [Blattamonas nauphoetae]
MNSDIVLGAVSSLSQHLQSFLKTSEKPQLFVDPELYDGISLVLLLDNYTSVKPQCLSDTVQIPRYSNCILLIRPSASTIAQLGSFLQASNNVTALCVPEKPRNIEELLSYVDLSKLKVHDFHWTSSVIDTDLIHLHCPHVFADYAIKGDTSSTAYIARGLHDVFVGTAFPKNVLLKGDLSSLVFRQICDMMSNPPPSTQQSNSTPLNLAFENLIILDRTCDMISPFITPYSITAQIAEFLDVRHEFLLYLPDEEHPGTHSVIPLVRYKNAAIYRFGDSPITGAHTVLKELKQITDTLKQNKGDLDLMGLQSAVNDLKRDAHLRNDTTNLAPPLQLLLTLFPMPSFHDRIQLEINILFSSLIKEISSSQPKNATNDIVSTLFGKTESRGASEQATKNIKFYIEKSLFLSPTDSFSNTFRNDTVSIRTPHIASFGYNPSFLSLIRLLFLVSITNQTSSDFAEIISIISAYGGSEYEDILTLLDSIGLLQKTRRDPAPQNSEIIAHLPQFRTPSNSYSVLSSAFQLIFGDDDSESKTKRVRSLIQLDKDYYPKQPQNQPVSLVHPEYTPLIARLVQFSFERFGWKNAHQIIRDYLPGEFAAFTRVPSQRQDRYETQPTATVDPLPIQPTLVVVIGGLTYFELAGLRALKSMIGAPLVFATTSVETADSFVGKLVELT